MFKPKEKLVYRGHGVVTVKCIHTILVAGKEKEFYILTSDISQMTFVVPTDNSELIRPLASESEVERTLDFIRNGKVKPDKTTWNRRYRDYMEDLKTGDFFKIGQVYKNLFTLRETKELSFGERKMFDHAKELLKSEISLVLGSNFIEVNGIEYGVFKIETVG